MSSIQFHHPFPTSGDFSQFRPHHLFHLFNDLDNHLTGHRAPAQRPFNPRFDVRESEDAYHLDGELPGIAQKDIDIEFSDAQTLVIKGRTEREYHRTEPEDVTETDENANADEKEAATDRKKKDTHHFWASERTVGEFQRTFSFPSRVDHDSVTASLKNGVLSVVVPKATNLPAKKILVE